MFSRIIWKISYKKVIDVYVCADFPEKRHKIWTRQSTFAGGPTVVQSSNPGPPKQKPNSSYGFGSRIDRFTAIQSTPSSPMVETPSLKWFVREIDIGDSGKKVAPGKPVVPGSNPAHARHHPGMFGHRQVRTRSRYDCHFSTGSSVPMGKFLNKKTHSFLFCPQFFHFWFIFPFYFLNI